MSKKKRNITLSFICGGGFFALLWIIFYVGSVIDVGNGEWYDIPYIWTSTLFLIGLFVAAVTFGVNGSE